MPVIQVIEAQSARTWSLAITSITNRRGRSRGVSDLRADASVAAQILGRTYSARSAG
jgi:hypothetical protein